MSIPVYVATGFLDSGKTTFLNNLLNKNESKEINILVVQFETGEEEIDSINDNFTVMSFRKKTLEQQPGEISKHIDDVIEKNDFDEVWIEWNGVASISQLQSLFLHSSLYKKCSIQKIFHIADACVVENLIGRTGNALIDQISESDFIALRSVGSASEFRRIRRAIREINPGVSVYKINEYDDLYSHLFNRKENPVSLFLLVVAFFVAIYLILKPILDACQLPVNAVINIFLGIILQAFPFLLIGVLLSSAIQIFVPQSLIEQKFPKSIGLGMLASIVGGFCLPVCDCASIPVFRSLVKKGIPLPAAITFMTVSPVINPVVILSTYYAFGGDSSIVIARVCLGIISSVTIGLIFALHPPKDQVLSKGKLDKIMCSCNFYEDTESIETFRRKLYLFLRHSEAEFFNVGKYLIIGTLISSIFQVAGTKLFVSAQSGTNLAVSTAVMMIMAFALSLCSSSDAVIARSFSSQFPMGAIMGFLVFGPMMDIKNVLMLSSGFTKRFIGKLLFTIFAVCFFAVFMFSIMGGI